MNNEKQFIASFVRDICNEEYKSAENNLQAAVEIKLKDRIKAAKDTFYKEIHR
jgi:hypothetical protein